MAWTPSGSLLLAAAFADSEMARNTEHDAAVGVFVDRDIGAVDFIAVAWIANFFYAAHLYLFF